MSAETVLRTEDLTVSYGTGCALRELELTVARGRITTIIGSNGAGKTTLMRAVAGLRRPSRGRITFHGTDLSGLTTDRIVRLGIALVPEGRRLFGGMTVRENLEIGAYLRADAAAVRRDFERVLGYFPGIRDRLATSCDLLSGGQQQMVSIGRALMAAPKLLMLDEPSIGLAPNIVSTIGQIIKSISKDGVDILLVEQNAKMALRIAHDAYVLESGVITLQGEASEIESSPAVREAYLGL